MSDIQHPDVPYKCYALSAKGEKVTIDSLRIYTLRTVMDDIRGKPYEGFYWEDKFSSGPNGPFSSIHSAFENYVGVLKADKVSEALASQDTVVPKDNVINVNFYLKQRLSK
jgi:hypothetical protein